MKLAITNLFWIVSRNLIQEVIGEPLRTQNNFLFSCWISREFWRMIPTGWYKNYGTATVISCYRWYCPLSSFCVCFTITVLADKHNKRSCSNAIFLLNAAQSSCCNSPLNITLIILLGCIGNNWVVPLFLVKSTLTVFSNLSEIG